MRPKKMLILFLLILTFSMTTGFRMNEQHFQEVQIAMQREAKGTAGWSGSTEDVMNEIRQGRYASDQVAYFVSKGYLTSYINELLALGYLSSETVSADNTQANVQSAITITTDLDYFAIFDPTYYYNTYPDVRSAVGTDAATLLNHFLTSGIYEGRQGNADFNVLVYAQKNPDLYALYGNNLPQYYLHYMIQGKAEGRVAK